MTKRPSLAGSMRIIREDTTPNPEALIAERPAESEVITEAKPAKLDKTAKLPKSQSAAAGERHAGMKKMLIPLDEATHRRLKARAAEEGKTLEKAVQDACAAYVGR